MKRAEVLQQRKKLVKLIEEQVRAEIMARYGPFTDLEFIEYSLTKVKKECEIRELLYDESDLYKLGIRWGLLKLKRGERGSK